MSVVHKGTLFRRMASSIFDFCLEMGSGLLGSYFGAMVAALVVSLRNESPQQMQSSIWNGFGFGFVFWALSISFLNRVLIQGVSRSSIGKKVFKLELISCHQPLTWSTVVKRWVFGVSWFAIGGLGYFYAFFNREGRALHDVLTDTDVVPLYYGTSMALDHAETEFVPTQALSPSMTAQIASRVLIISQSHAERPMAEVIQFPIRQVTSVATQVANGDENPTEKKKVA